MNKEELPVNEISRLLLDWYDQHRRSLPWRGTGDPYAIWVSETMLQQTRVVTVLDYYPRFLSAFPTVQALAAAPEEAVLKHWEGLGYYSRARNLHKGAKQVCEQYGGTLPADEHQLGEICGIGPYTAGAIASIAFQLPVPAVDGNVIRVLSRVLGLRENMGMSTAKKELTDAATQLIAKLRPGDWNQALMDLGSAICVPGTPDCDACPLRVCCNAFHAGDAEELPVLPKKKAPKVIQYDQFLVFSERGVLMRCRTENLLKGLWVYPMAEGWHEAQDFAAVLRKMTGLHAEGFIIRNQARHVFTHQVWEMRICLCKTEETETLPGWKWVTLDDMRSMTIPTAVKAAKAIAESAMRME